MCVCVCGPTTRGLKITRGCFVVGTVSGRQECVLQVPARLTGLTLIKVEQNGRLCFSRAENAFRHQ